MAVATRTAALPRNDMVDALVAYAGANAKITLYDGSVPADADTALAGQTPLVTLTIPSFTVAGVVATAAAIASALAIATGTATFFRVYKTDGTTVVWQGTVGLADADCVLNDTDLVEGAGVTITALTYTLGA